MNKEFEKILERLNEMIHPKQLYFCKYAKGECKHLDNDDKNCAECTVELAKEIVHEVAEEYISTEHINCSTDTSTNTSTNGWIPCSERLPDDGIDVLVWFEYYRFGNYNRLYKTIGISYTYNGKWSGFVNGTSGWTDLRIIAWQPLPQPYKESE